ncbi:hypothetical protein Tco_1407789 [Tanacetum coccineum]
MLEEIIDELMFKMKSLRDTHGLSSRNTSSYYVTHPTSVVDYDDEYQQDDVHTNSEDPLASKMLFKTDDITSVAGPSYDYAFISEVQSSSNNENVEQIDNEDTLDDASKSQQKVYEKLNDPIAVANKQNCWTIDYSQINALYKDFVPQKELSAEQKYFPSSFIPSDKTSNATPSISQINADVCKPVSFCGLMLVVVQCIMRGAFDTAEKFIEKCLGHALALEMD